MSRQAASDSEAQDAGTRSTIESVEAGASAVRVTVDGSSFFCALPFLAEFGLAVADFRVGGELDASALEALSLASEATEAVKRASALLARAEQSRHLLGAKLAQRGLGSRAIKLALDKLEGEGLLSDRRFAEAWLRSRRGSEGANPRKLIAGLRAKGIGEETADAAMRTVFGEEERSALLGRAARRELAHLERIGGLRPSARRAELLARLRAQGFRSNEIRAWLEGLHGEE